MRDDSILERVCIVCGATLIKRPKESTGQFAGRKSCGGACRAKAGWLHPDQINRQQTGRMSIRPCETCGKAFKPGIGGQRFCSISCGSLHTWKNRIEENNLRSEIICAHCGNTFTVLKSAVRIGQGKFCSHECHSASRRYPERVLTCANCSKEFTTRKLHTRTYCSHKCHRIAELKKARFHHSQFEESVVDGLVELGYQVVPQYRIGRFKTDAFLPQLMTVVECQGDYFHCNPTVYPDGPRDLIQRQTAERDARRKPFIEGQGYRMIFVWESDVNDFGVIDALERVGLRRVLT